MGGAVGKVSSSPTVGSPSNHSRFSVDKSGITKFLRGSPRDEEQQSQTSGNGDATRSKYTILKRLKGKEIVESCDSTDSVSGTAGGGGGGGGRKGRGLVSINKSGGWRRIDRVTVS